MQRRWRGVLASAGVVALLLYAVPAAAVENVRTPVLAAGDYHSLVSVPGAVPKAFGDNYDGQLGDGSRNDTSTPVDIVPPRHLATLAAGSGTSFGIDPFGGLWRWGAYSIGTVDYLLTPSRQAEGVRFEQVAAGHLAAAAIATDGSLWTWGSVAGESVPVRLGSSSDWHQVSSGGWHFLAIRDNGTLWAWGANSSGQVGNGTTADAATPVQIGSDTDWAAVSAGYSHSLAVKKDGTLWTWGSNVSGRLGDGTNEDRLAPVPSAVPTGWASVSAGYSHSLGIREGRLYAWGDNLHAQVGTGVGGGYYATPRQIGNEADWLTVDAGRAHSLGWRATEGLFGWGQNSDGQLGVETTTVARAPMAIPLRLTPLAAETTELRLSPATKTIVAGDSVSLSGVLDASSPLGGRTVVLEASSNGIDFAAVATATTAAGTGAYAFAVSPLEKSWYRATFAGTETFASDTSTTSVVSVKARISNPIAPAAMYRGRKALVYGMLAPRHAAGATGVRIYRERYEGGRWVRYSGYTYAPLSAHSSRASKYAVSMSLPKSGRWRVRAYHVDAGHVGAWSPGYDYVSVK